MKRKVISTLVALSMVLTLLSGCVKTDKAAKQTPETTETEKENEGTETAEGQTEDTQGGKKFAAFLPTMTNPYWVSEMGQLEEDIKANGGTLQVFDAQSDQAKQISQVEDAISADYDLFFISAFDADGVRPALEAAHSGGVPVIAIDTSVADIDLVECQVTADNAQAGYLAGQALGEVLEDGAKVGIIGLSVNMDCRARSENFVKGLKEKLPNAEIVFEQEGNGTTDTALSIMENMIQSYPDLNGLFTINDPSSLGGVAALESANMLEQVKVASVDGSKDGVAATMEGKMIGTAAQFPTEVAKTCLENAYKILKGETIAEKEVKVPSQWINAENGAQLKGY